MRTVTQERAGRSRRAILDAARRLFAERGYADVPVSEIVLASGLTKGAFYFHFPSKQDLALAVLDDANERWGRMLADELATTSDPLERLFAVPRLIVRAARDGDGPSAMRRLSDDLCRDPEVRDQVCTRPASGSMRPRRLPGRAGGRRHPVRPRAALLAEVAIAGFFGSQTITDQFGDDDLERRIEALIALVSQAVTRPQ